MSQLWITEDQNREIIVIHENVLSLGKADSTLTLDDIQNPEVFHQLFSVPLSYIQLIKIGELNPKITIEYSKNSSFDFEITNESARQEFKDKILELLPKSKTEQKKSSDIALIKKPLIAMAVIVLFYLLVLSSGIHSNSTKNTLVIMTFVEAIASLGFINYTLIFAALFVFAGIVLIRKLHARNAELWIEVRH